MATFAVADECVFDNTTKLRRRNFTSVRTVIAPIKILRREVEMMMLDLKMHRLQREQRRREDDFDAFMIIDQRVKFMYK
jgi:hypothetical protein